MNNSVIPLDDTDRTILRILQKEGRLANIELAGRLGLSPSTCLRRVKSLEDAKVIERYIAVIAPEKVGIGMTVFARLWLTGQDARTVDHFIEAVRKLPQVTECYLMAGDCDFLLRVVAADLTAYRLFQIRHLTRIKGVRSIKTDIPMQTVKTSYELPM
jgi:Lrp/AsnC family leucine-responsive transcriptional regulator